MVTPAPTGMVSFLFTDVVGSTRSWEADPAGMAASIELHDSIVRRCIEEGGGHVFSTAGDGFGAAFTAPHEAITTAVRIQHQVLAADWSGPALQVRMGLHTGAVAERDDDYFGPAVNRAARIQAAGNGGQILVSRTTAEAAADWLDSDTTLADMGTHHLKDLEEPEHLFEVRHPGLPEVSDPIKVVDAHRHNLPEYLTSFVGRSDQLEGLADLLDGHRLVVLTGVGGTGKTRLAVESARRMVGRFPDGTWLVELAPVTNPTFTMTAIGDTWGLRPGEGASIDEVVARYLRTKELLVIIDNCEHLLDAAASAIRHLLDSSPGVQVVATSRESLGIPGEALLQVPSLPLSADAGELDSEAVHLFLDRAAEARPDFSPGRSDLEAIVRICRRVDGIPLGVELAAARLRSLAPAELAHRLEGSFRILAGSAKASLPRQRTLSATIDWSYDLLTPQERDLFRRLSVFAGGFDLAAAEGVCTGEGVKAWEVLDLVDSLIDKSLVLTSQTKAGGTRYRLLEPVRQYAQERLSDSRKAEETQLLHASYFSDLVGIASPGLRSPDQQDWTGRLHIDYPNIRAALTTLAEARDHSRYLQMVFDLFCYWMSAGMQLEAIDSALAVLEHARADTDPSLRVKTWWTTAFLGAQITRPESVGYANQGLSLARSLEDDNMIGRMELALGAAIRHSTSDPGYLDHLTEGSRLLDANPEPAWWEPTWDRALSDFLLFEYLPAEDERWVEHYEAATNGFESLGDEAFLAAALTMSSMPSSTLGKEKEPNLLRAMEITGRLDLPLWRGHARLYFGINLLVQESHAEAADYLGTGAVDLEECGDLSCWAHARRYGAWSELSLGAPEKARRWILDVIDSLPDLPLKEIHKPRTLDLAVDLLVAAGEHEWAAVALGLAQRTELEVAAVMGRGHDRLRTEIVRVLGQSRADELLAEGDSLDLDEGLAAIREWLEQMSPAGTPV